MTGPRPNALARCLVAPAVQVLPRDRRERYREEFRTELCELGGPAQISAAASLLRGSLSLRYALLDRQVAAQSVTRRPISCRFGRHHYVGRRDVALAKEQHHLSYRCVRCGSYFERKPDEEEGFDVEAFRRNSDMIGGAGF